MPDITARWQAWEGSEFGLEHLDLRSESGGIRAAGIVIGTDGGPFGLFYRLRMDARWHIRDARLETTTGARLHLRSDGEGRWTMDGAALPALDGCIDIDIESTPFTNTLPIRRLDFALGDARTLRLAYVRVPTLAVAEGSQRYTALSPGRLYRFESLDHDFVADLPVDRHGLVRDYPELFRRLL
jgi:hypothetical protein